MSIHRRMKRLERRRTLAGGWQPATTGSAESALFDRSFDVAVAAGDLERVAGAPGSVPATAASLGCATSALESLATAMLKTRGLLVRQAEEAEDGEATGDVEQLSRLLYAISQNLRFAAEAADLGRQAAEEAGLAESEERAAATPADVSA